MHKDITDNVFADDSRLRQILLNLIGNALKFTSTGSISVEVDMVDVENNLVQVNVIDTGIGVSSSRIGNLFQSFSQAEISTSRTYGGTGLGLAISKRLVEMMGGAMWLKSTEGVGSTFSFTIKLPPVQLQNSMMDLFLTSSSKNGNVFNTSMASEFPLRILVAEDNQINMKLLKILLKKMGYFTVHDVTDGKQAVDAIIEQPGFFDLVLMDLQMPVESGISAAMRIRSIDSNYKKPVIIAVTAAAFKKDEKEALDAGMNGVVTKPIKFNDLEFIIRSHFSPSI